MAHTIRFSYASLLILLASCGSDSVDGNMDSNLSSSTTLSSEKPISSASVAECIDKSDSTHYTDCRNGRTYEIAKIGEQTWFTQNLDLAMGTGTLCYDENAENCKEYGRLYTWAIASSICPDGWKLPDTSDWNELISSVKGPGSAESSKMRISESQGGGLITGAYEDMGSFAYFWSGSRKNSDAFYIQWKEDNDSALFTLSPPNNAFSVRCMKEPGITHISSTVPSSSRATSLSSLNSLISSSALSPSSSSSSLSKFPYEYLTDIRDSNVYRVLQFGTKKWLVDNLQYIPTTGTSFCLEHGDDCSKYGRYYDFQALKGVCPAGYTTPSYNNCDSLFNLYLDKDGEYDYGALLEVAPYTVGTNSSGFEALFGGVYQPGRSTNKAVGSESIYWIGFYFGDEGTLWRPSVGGFMGITLKDYYAPVRCVSIADYSANSMSSSSLSSSSSTPTIIHGNPLVIGTESYATVIIGTQTWMARNLNTPLESGSISHESCGEECENYGAWYTKTGAASACPSGWSLPSKSDWTTLAQAGGGVSLVGPKLRANDARWKPNDGEDLFGFAALPAGLYTSIYSRFEDMSWWGYFWTSDGTVTTLESGTNQMSFGSYSGDKYFSVRCIKNP